MSSDSGIGAGSGAPWYRVVAIPDAPYGGTAERDYASVLPALLDAAKSRRPFVTGWLSRGARGAAAVPHQRGTAADRSAGRTRRASRASRRQRSQPTPPRPAPASCSSPGARAASRCRRSWANSTSLSGDPAPAARHRRSRPRRPAGPAAAPVARRERRAAWHAAELVRVRADDVDGEAIRLARGR